MLLCACYVIAEGAGVVPDNGIAVMNGIIRTANTRLFAVDRINPARSTSAVKFVQISDTFYVGGMIDRCHGEFKRNSLRLTEAFRNVKNTVPVLYRHRTRR